MIEKQLAGAFAGPLKSAFTARVCASRKMSAIPVMIPAPVLTPHGSLMLADMREALALEAEQGARLQEAFARGAGHGLLSLGIDEIGASLPPVLSYWREIGTLYATALCALPNIGESDTKPPVPLPANNTLDRIEAESKSMPSADY